METEKSQMKDCGLDQQRSLMRTMRKFLFMAVAMAALVATAAAQGTRGNDNDDDRRGDGDEHHKYAIGLWGDLPYSDVQAQVGVPNLIADMNRHDLAFT